MTRLWDRLLGFMVTVVVIGIALYLFVGLIAPFMPYILIGIVLAGIGYVGAKVYQRQRYW